MSVILKSHADFRRFLADPRARVTLIENTQIEKRSPEARSEYEAKGLYRERRVKKLQTNGVAFANPVDPAAAPSWLYWDGGTRQWTFVDDVVTVPSTAYPGEHLRYRCSLAA